MSIEIGTMLFQLVAFIILMLLVSKFALRPILNTMKKRQDHIEDQIEDAEENRKKSEKLLEEQRTALNEARKEAKEIIERARAQKDRESEAIIKQAQERAGRILEEATIEIKREKEKALASLRDEVGVLSIQLASKMLQKELDKKEQSELVSSYLDEVGRLQ